MHVQSSSDAEEVARKQEKSTGYKEENKAEDLVRGGRFFLKFWCSLKRLSNKLEIDCRL